MTRLALINGRLIGGCGRQEGWGLVMGVTIVQDGRVVKDRLGAPCRTTR